MKKFLPILIPIAIFLLLKLTNLGIRLSDTNIYFYTAYQLLQGKVLYKDIFFTNFPVLPYISMIYFYIVGKSLSWYYITAAIEASLVALLIFYLTLKKIKDKLIALTSSLLYLFSFIILATTDHQTGVFLASLFAVLSYVFVFEKKQYVFGGVFIALALLTKAYFLPVFLAILLTLFFERVPLSGTSRENDNSRQARIIKFLAGCFVATIAVLLPSLLFARNDLMKDVFLYSLTRSQGISKINILWFFLRHDFLLVVALLFSLFAIRRYLFFGLLSLFSLLFILFYQDPYYLYLNFTIPFLCLSFANLHIFLRERFHIQKMVVPTIVVIFLLINLIIYFSSYRTVQKVERVDQLLSLIHKENPPVLYGVNSIAPALAYLSDKPLLNDIVDTNENIFRKGFLSVDTLTNDAIDQRAMIITPGAFYPDFNILNDITGGIFDEEKMTESCELKGSFPIKTEGIENRLNLFRC